MDRKFFKVVIIAMLLVCVYTTIASALSFSVIMEPSKRVVPASTEFTVEIKVSNLDVGTNGINTLCGNLIYDKAVFESIGESSIEGRNGWSHSFNPDNNGKITLTKMSFVKTDEEVFQVTFKTKADLPDDKKGLIQFKQISASNSASEITASDVSIEIKIGDEDTSNDGNVSVTPNNTANNNTNKNTENTAENTTGNKIGITPSNTANKNTTNTNTNKATNTNTNKATNTNTNKNTNKEVAPYVNSTNTTNEDIPYAGAEDYMLYFIGAVVAIAIVFYIKFERINKEMN